MNDRHIFVRLEDDSAYMKPGALVVCRLSLSWITNEKRQSRKRISPLSFYASEDDPCASFVPIRPVHSDFATPRVISTARAFIDECRGGHPECEPRTPTRLPTRVLDVTGSQVKLHTPGCHELGEYVTLSYCWGGPQPLLLTQHTVDEFRSGLDESRLPPTIRDAVTATRLLGFRYLWVDALCIIQDSEQDKLFEIGNMGEVYRNSIVTLSASRSSSVNQGFSPGIKGQDNGIKVSGSSEGVAVELSLAGGHKGRLNLAKKIYDQFEALPLNQRGWALQEYLLSGRILAFGNEAVWMCGKHKHRPLVPSIMYIAPFPSLARTTLSAVRQLKADERASIWADVVNDFTGRDLTVADDRVWALAGVINVFQVAWADKCMWGLWRSNFVVDAWWRRSRHAKPALSNTRSKRAPSWSWMSLNSQVQQRDMAVRSTTASLVSVADDSGWAINLHARLLPTPHQPDVELPNTEAAQSVVVQAQDSLSLLTSVLRHTQQQQRLILHMDLLEDEVDGKPKLLLQLGEHASGFSEGLIVVQEMAGDITFRRVGFFESCDDSHLWASAQYQTVRLI
ncbi:heterokaryon incompatibility protein-domain-containing protein [Podospora didyma]|uniref:Heterokaryon incompatibility protein-domain-containing protein n=1 Tax=Podospora didyma TaxID=330526 RepID=A0AAE0P3W4_9PEZI|nr:heterokaryon incompatibility protein-domain-containing protein [Podospora didyma]